MSPGNAPIKLENPQKKEISEYKDKADSPKKKSLFGNFFSSKKEDVPKNKQIKAIRSDIKVDSQDNRNLIIKQDNIISFKNISKKGTFTFIKVHYVPTLNPLNSRLSIYDPTHAQTSLFIRSNKP